jgi:hypothetical protein
MYLQESLLHVHTIAADLYHSQSFKLGLLSRINMHSVYNRLSVASKATGSAGIIRLFVSLYDKRYRSM